MLGMWRKLRAKIYDFWTAQETKNSLVAILTGNSLSQTPRCRQVSLLGNLLEETLKDSESFSGDSCDFLTVASWLVHFLQNRLVAGAQRYKRQ
jgi:hypothetical protein